MNKYLLKLILVFQFLNMNTATAGSHQFVDFNKSHSAKLEQWKTLHSLAAAVLKINSAPAELKRQAHNILNGKDTPLPAFKISHNSLEFKLEGLQYSLKKMKGSTYKLNGKTIDLESQQWKKQQANFLPPQFSDLFVERAEALAPVAYFIIWGIVIILSSGCIVMALGDQKSGSTVSAKWIRVNKFNFNSAVQALRQGFKEMGCSAHADTLPVGTQIDYASLFSNYCGKLAKNEDAEIDSLTAQYCKDTSCTKTESTTFTQLPDLDQQFIKEMLADETFRNECIEAFKNPAPTENSKSSNVQ